MKAKYKKGQMVYGVEWKGKRRVSVTYGKITRVGNLIPDGFSYHLDGDTFGILDKNVTDDPQKIWDVITQYDKKGEWGI